MEQHLLILLFITGFISPVLSISRRFVLIQQGKTWSDAQAYCRANFIDLANINSSDEMVRLQNVAQRQNFNSKAWMGLYNDINSWRWSFNNASLGNTNKWCSPQPDNSQGKEECGGVIKSCYFDGDCAGVRPYACFDDRNSGNDQFVYYSDLKTWRGAQTFCRQYHTDLASAKNNTEISIIQGNNPSSAIWIGLFRDSWKWTDQTNFPITWSFKQPDNALKNENCGYLYGGQAADAQCSVINPFFCSSDYLNKQIIRVKVQSNQAVNEFAVLAAILEKIKQKLRERGLTENITVVWRQQPGGVVLHKIKENNNAIQKSQLSQCATHYFN